MSKETKGLTHLNGLNEKMAWEELLGCCGASKWALKLMNARPLHNLEALHEQSERAFKTLQELDWLEAFSHHPRTDGMTATDEATRRALAIGSAAYEKKFGFTFIFCASSTSATDMLAALETRLNNDRQTELQNAADQQKQITRLRLEKLLSR